MVNIKALDILLYKRKVGVLTWLAGDRTIFAFEEDYINDATRETLSLYFEDRNGDFIPIVRPSSIQIPPFFSNLLPEGPLRDYLAVHAGVSAKREFFLLAALGADLPGAINARSSFDIDAHVQPSDSNTSKDQRDFLRFSLAGVQLKFSGIMERKGGLTILYS
jgi:serine/threonine-protein kinase HipA